ncbi:MAG: 2-C-methyl-D-erythritol 4-phosphate cytidylyltransferase [Silicimonas sp.]|nr:2-C-methyl-D-erythritol 4-phosphate cytidylyltransferase [Silicimonas sp.]
MSVAVVIVAAGRGRRLGGGTPKQYLPLSGECSLRRAVDAFLAVESVARVVPVIHPDDASLAKTALVTIDDRRLMSPVAGGETRARSVLKGLEALEDHRPEMVLIHDAARPFVSAEIIAAVIAALDKADGACAALPVVDAVWRAADAGPPQPVSRDGLWRAQTPQGFAFDRILDAHRRHDGSAADDVAVAVEAGLNVRFVKGSEQNYKITTDDDYARALSDIAAAKD